MIHAVRCTIFEYRGDIISIALYPSRYGGDRTSTAIAISIRDDNRADCAPGMVLAIIAPIMRFCRSRPRRSGGTSGHMNSRVYGAALTC